MKSEVVRLFQTFEHPCGYYPTRVAQNLVIDPLAPTLPLIYDQALSRGFRRAGGHVYRPHCKGCRACIASRVPVADFVADRSQRRCLRRNSDLTIAIEPARHSAEYFELYRRYIGTRHPGGGMDDPNDDDFSRFLYTTWSRTRFVEFRLGSRLLAVAVTDFGNSGLSSVYTFFDPDEESRGLGSYAILTQIELARRESVPYLYLGYWIEHHRKMHYKARFQPLEILRDGQWRRLTMSQKSPTS